MGDDGTPLRRILNEYRSPTWRESLAQLGVSLGAFLLAWILAYRTAAAPGVLFASSVVLAACFLVRLFVILHDCVHSSFFPSGTLNNAVGFCLGVTAMTPFACWRWEHSYHHAHSGNLDFREIGDVDTLTVREYGSLPRLRRIAYAVYRHPLCLFGFGAAYHFLIRFRLVTHLRLGQTKERKSVLWTNIGIMVFLVLGMALLDAKRFMLVQISVWGVSAGIGVWLFYVQHNFADTYWARQKQWTFDEAAMEGSSFYKLPGLLQWLFANIGYHHIHHLDSRIPNYRLRACFKDPRVPDPCRTVTLWQSLVGTRLKLWDEESRSLVTFRRAAKLLRQEA